MDDYCMAETEPDRIFVKNLSLRMFLGVREREKKTRQRVNITMEAFVESHEGKEDELETTVSYSDLIRVARNIAENSRYGLAETLADEIARNCLKNQNIKKIIITIEKPEASIYAESVGVIVTRTQRLRTES